MCFSAPVSFGASAVIGLTGIATLKSVKKKNEILFAAIPLIFALQQLVEGFLWISFGHEIINPILTFIFNFIAMFGWQIIMPVSIYLLEDKKNLLRRKILLVIIFIAVIHSLFILYIMISHSINASVLYGSIRYNIPNFPLYCGFTSSITYNAVILLSFWISSIKFIKIWGVLLLISSVLAFEFFRLMYFSVWCFFAAVLSILIYLFFKKR